MYKPTIGLEIHAEMKTKSKMFCDCPNNLEEKTPNINTCPICLAHPGTLPFANKKAVENVIKVGLSIGGRILENSKFDRKNYFYPDIPKAYQISQYDEPLVLGGELAGVKITRIHLEEDVARLVHSKDSAHTLVDFNRAGVPLMELVTEPVIYSAEKAREFAKELQLLLRYLGVSDADMEKGHMRVEVNISISKEQMANGIDQKLGTKVEVKNINSFSSVFGAIEYEIKRQSEALEKGESLVQETRGWDDIKKVTVSQRKKETAQDYRYFPEPDLPPMKTKELFNLDELKENLPELPWAKRERFKAEYELTTEAVDFLVNEREVAKFFEEAVSELKEILVSDYQVSQNATLYNYLATDLRGLLSEFKMDFSEIKFTPEKFSHLVANVLKNKITTRVAKDVLRKMLETGLDPEEIIKSEGLGQVSDEGAILAVVLEVIKENEKPANDYKGGNLNALQFLLGKAMGKLKGRANPAIIKELLEKELGK